MISGLHEFMCSFKYDPKKQTPRKKRPYTPLSSKTPQSSATPASSKSCQGSWVYNPPPCPTDETMTMSSVNIRNSTFATPVQQTEGRRYERVPAPFPDIEDMLLSGHPNRSCAHLPSRITEDHSNSKRISSGINHLSVESAQTFRDQTNVDGGKISDSLESSSSKVTAVSPDGVSKVDQETVTLETNFIGFDEVERIMELCKMFATGDMVPNRAMDPTRACRVLGLLEKEMNNPKIVKRQYHKLSILIHPDKCSHPQAGAAFASLSGAVRAIEGRTEAPGKLFGKLHLEMISKYLYNVAEPRMVVL